MTTSTTVRSKLKAFLEGVLVAIFSVSVGLCAFVLLAAIADSLVSIGRSDRLTAEHEARIKILEEKVRQQSFEFSLPRNVSVLPQ